MEFLLAGIKVGHASHPQFLTGLTVFLCPEGTIGGVDVRGPAPGTREITLLSPMKSVMTINAILLSGGSAFGLSAADGVVNYLAERGIGHPTPIKNIPIVSAAIVYDLMLGGGSFYPDAAMAYQACEVAGKNPIEQGNVGAGTGVTVGKWGDPSAIMKGGFGLASHKIGELEVGAAAVVNCIGDVVNDDGTVLAGARDPEGGWLVAGDPWRQFPEMPPANLMTNTTLVVVMTNAIMDKVGANRLAERVHDGLSITIRPTHTTHDGDATFALSTGQVEAPFDLVGNVAVSTVVQAIQNGVRYAKTEANVPGLAG